jgi:hypothetical protein
MQNENEGPILITINECAKILNIGRNQMLKLAKIKGFPALIFPHKILIDKQQVPNWIAKNYGQFK